MTLLHSNRDMGSVRKRSQNWMLTTRAVKSWYWNSKRLNWKKIVGAGKKRYLFHWISLYFKNLPKTSTNKFRFFHSDLAWNIPCVRSLVFKLFKCIDFLWLSMFVRQPFYGQYVK